MLVQKLIHSGKSVLYAQLVRHLQRLDQTAVAFYICSLRTSRQYGLAEALRSIAAQLVRHNRDRAVFVHSDYVLKGTTPSISVLKQLVPCLLSGMPGCRLLVDGLDECIQAEQEEMLKVLLPFAVSKSIGTKCKLAVFSQDTGYIRRMLRCHTCVFLADQSHALEYSIKAYVQHEIAGLQSGFDDMEVSDDLLETIQRTIVSKADGRWRQYLEVVN
jgi:hypothetical protein